MRLARKSSSHAATFRLRRKESFPGGFSHQIESDVLYGREVCGSVIGTQAAFIVSEDHVEHPMEAASGEPPVNLAPEMRARSNPPGEALIILANGIRPREVFRPRGRPTHRCVACQSRCRGDPAPSGFGVRHTPCREKASFGALTRYKTAIAKALLRVRTTAVSHQVKRA